MCPDDGSKWTYKILSYSKLINEIYDSELGATAILFLISIDNPVSPLQ